MQTSPGNAHSPPRLCPPHLRPIIPVRYRTLKIVAFSSIMNASYAISVRRASGLPSASFRFHLAMDTLAVRLAVPPDGSAGDLNPQVSAPCRAHNEERVQLKTKLHTFKAYPLASINAFKISAN